MDSIAAPHSLAVPLDVLANSHARKNRGWAPSHAVTADPHVVMRHSKNSLGSVMGVHVVDLTIGKSDRELNCSQRNGAFRLPNCC